MWIYEKKLQYPVNIRKTNPKLAMAIMSQLGGPDGELSAALRYMNQRYTMPSNEVIALLTDIAAEELSHVELISTIIYQLTRDLSMEEIKASGFDAYYTDHTTAIYPVNAAGNNFVSQYFQSKGDPIADLSEDMAAEQKARVTYENLIRLVDDEDVKRPLEFLREREIVHYQRFAEALGFIREKLDCSNYYAYNPSFD